MMSSSKTANTNKGDDYSVCQSVRSRGVRHSRRLKKENASATSSAGDRNASLENTANYRTSHCDADSVFPSSQQTESFVRNSASRRNRRSRKSTVGSSVSGDNIERTPKGSESGSRSPTEIINRLSPPVTPVRGSGRVRRTPSFYERLKRFEESKETSTPKSTALRPGKYLDESLSPGISPYRSPELEDSHLSKKERVPSRQGQGVAATTGSTRHYKTITTSFRGPTSKPLSSSVEKTPISSSKKRYSANFNNSSNFSADSVSSTEWNKKGHSTSERRVTPPHTGHQQKQQRARDVLKAFGKRFFTSKPKSASSASGQQQVANSSPRRDQNSKFDTPTPPTPNRPKLQPSPFQQRKDIFERRDSNSHKVSYTWNKPKSRMTDVAQSPLNSTPAELPTPPASPVKNKSVENSDVETAVEEVEEMLKQFTDPDKRVKIKETIRLLKQSLQEGDSTTSGGTLDDPEIVAGKETGLSEKPLSASLSRLSNRSTSLRDSRQIPQSSTSSVARANSFNFSRPKDFILKKVGSSPLVTKVPDSKPEDFKEYADSLNNNIPKFKNPITSSHNKTASPFLFSVKPSIAASSGDTSIVENSSALRRTESAKENRSSDFSPISVVPGNVRRSKSILGRILGQKIDSEKPPFQPRFADLAEQKSPTVDLSTKPESPKPAPRKKAPSTGPLKAPPSPLHRTLSKSKPSERRNSLESNSSEDSTSTQSDQVFEVTLSDSGSHSSESSGHASPTLSEIIEADKNKVKNNESCSLSNAEDANSSTPTVENIEEDTALNYSKDNLEKEPREETPADSEKFLQPEPPKKKKHIIHQPVTSQSVLLETETADLFHVQIIRPISRKNRDVTKKRTKKESKRKRSGEETKRTSVTSEEEYNPDMDRYSTRALQNRTSVKSQISGFSATEDGVNAKGIDRKTPTSRRLKERSNKPLGTGDDLKSRLQKYKSKTNGENLEESPKRSVRKSEKKSERHGDVIVTSSPEKTVIMLETNAPKTARERLEARKKSELRNGSANEDTRVRYTRRSKVDSSSEKAEDKLDKASKLAVQEMKDITSKIATKSSRLRTTKHEDVNNNKAEEVVAPSNGNGELAVEDSLSNWSARRRKKREQKLEMTPVSSGNEHEKSTDDEPKEGEIEKQEIRASMKHPHSTPSLSGLDGYTLKLKVNGTSKFASHAEEHEDVQEEENAEANEDHDGLEFSTERSNERKSSSSSSGSVPVVESQEDVTVNEKNAAENQISVDVDDEITVDQSEAREIVDAEKVETPNDVDTSLGNGDLREDHSSDSNKETKEAEEQKVENDEDVMRTEEKQDDGADEADDKELQENKSDFESQSQENEIVNQTPPPSPYKSSDGESESQIEIVVQEATEPSLTEINETQKKEVEAEGKDIKSDSKLEIESQTEDIVDAPKPKSRKHKKPASEEESTEVTQETPIETATTEVKDDSSVGKDTVTKPQEASVTDSKDESNKMRFSFDNLEQISDIKVLERMLDMTSEYEQRRKIRSAIRALKRGEKPAISKDSDPSKKSSIAQLKANLEAKKRNESKSAGKTRDAKISSTPRDTAKEARLTPRQTTKTDKSSDLASKYLIDKTEKPPSSRMTSSAGKKKVGSIFDREFDDDDKKKKSASRMADLEKRQAERRRELQRNRSMPATSSKDARKAFVAKLEADAPKSQQKKVGRSPTFVVPNANNAKQLLLKWCQSKTRGYEHVDIMNYSSSWASGMAFCALVHYFFPQAFDYSKLDPKNRAENLDLAFTKADEIGDIPQLLDTEDMVAMAEPDWKCVYTYLGEFYKRIRDLGLT